MDGQEAWEAAYGQLELQLDRANFETWIKGAFFIAQEENVFVIGVRNTYARDMLQHRLYRSVRRVLGDVCGYPVELRFEVRRKDQPAEPPRRDAPRKPKNESASDMPLFRLLEERRTITEDENNTPPLHEHIRRPRVDVPESELNPDQTFERFIVNGSNRIAYEAARAVSESPARVYNPLLIYGGVGLGKTHLLQAIAHVCQKREQRVIYIPSEAFTNDLVDAIRHKTTAMFRDKYRSADVLLVDDIQFIAGKDSTQEEFFHTFNSLFTFQKQIVLASDRHPRELTTLEPRLRSRFEGGLITDIQPLEYESRLALLQMWAQERGVKLDAGVLEVVAERASHNVRELHGAFNQIIAKAHLTSRPLTVDSATSTLAAFAEPREYAKQPYREATPEQIIDAVTAHFNVTRRDLSGKKRAGYINNARQIAMYLIREMTDISLSQIGDYFGGRSHTTVLHACNKITEELARDVALRRTIQDIRAQLG